MFLEWESNSEKLQIISGKFQNGEKFKNNAINNVKTNFSEPSDYRKYKILQRIFLNQWHEKYFSSLLYVHDMLDF